MKKVCIDKKCFNEHVLCGLIFTVVAIIALVGIILLFTGNNTGGATYQQYVHRPVVVGPDYVCAQVQCDFGTAFFLRTDRLTGNPICSCPDGSTYQVDARVQY